MFSEFVRATILLAAVLAVPGVAWADPFTVDSFMTVLSQQYSISGSGALYPSGVFETFAFSEASDQPITSSRVYEFANGSQCPSGGAFFNNTAVGSVTSVEASVSASAFIFDVGCAAAISGTSVASITFQPLVGWLALEVSGLNWGYDLNDGLAEVFDETAGQMVLNRALRDGPLIASMPFDLGHTYTIRALAVSGLSGDGARLQVTQVPEPGSTVMLLSVGLVGLGVARRRASRTQQKKEPLPRIQLPRC